jgi:hypothetical protein
MLKRLILQQLKKGNIMTAIIKTIKSDYSTMFFNIVNAEYLTDALDNLFAMLMKTIVLFFLVGAPLFTGYQALLLKVGYGDMSNKLWLLVGIFACIPTFKIIILVLTSEVKAVKNPLKIQQEAEEMIIKPVIVETKTPRGKSLIQKRENSRLRSLILKDLLRCFSMSNASDLTEKEVKVLNRLDKIQTSEEWSDSTCRLVETFLRS